MEANPQGPVSPGVVSPSLDIKGDNINSMAPGHGHSGTGNVQGQKDTVTGPCEEFGCAGPRSTARASVKFYCSDRSIRNHAAYPHPKPVFADPDDLETDLLRM